MKKTDTKKYMTKTIFFDMDCISSFLWIKSEHLLLDFFPNKMVLPAQAYEEISKVSHLKQRVDIMTDSGNLLVEEIPDDEESIYLYLDLIEPNSTNHFPIIGRGEAAAIILTLKQNGILASNNLRDVMYYVKLYYLEHTTSADIIHQMVNKGFLTIDQADEIWIKMVNKKTKLPFATYLEYRANIKN